MSRKYQVSYYEGKSAKEINVKEYVDVIKKRFWMIALITVFTTLAGYWYSTLNDTPLYQASTRMIIGSGSEDMNTLMVMIKDPIVMELVKDELQLSRTSEEIASQIVVTRIDDSQVVEISVTDLDSKVAVEIANATATSYKSEIVNILGFSDVQLLSEAKENPYPINQSQNGVIILSFIVGIILGIGLVFLLDSLDGKVRQEREIEDILGVPVLGSVSNMSKRRLIQAAGDKHQTNVGGETIAIKQKA